MTDKREGAPVEPWQTVEKKSTRKKEKKKKVHNVGTAPSQREEKDNNKTANAKGNKPAVGHRRRAPRTAAVAIKGTTEGFSYAAALKNLRENMALPELEIQSSHIRKSANGGIIIEIPGEDKAAKADKLKERISKVLGPTAKVTRPSVKGELRIIGMDDSVIAEEVADVVAANGGCKGEEVKVGLIRLMSNGLFTVWVSCPLSAAIKVSRSGKIRIGWTIAKVEMLKARPTMCYRCWSRGHLQARCDSATDRSNTCYRCGKEGHRASDCQNPVSCAPCREQGKEDDHRVGSARCKADPLTKGKNPLRERVPDSRMDVEEELIRRAEGHAHL